MKTNGTLFQICLLGAVMMMLPATVQAQFTYTTNSGVITITGDTNIPVNGVVIIPSTINGYPVTSIGEEAFFHATSMTSVTFPGSVTSIGNLAFQDCYGLTSVMIGTNVTSIGTQAFYNCTNLTSVTIPGSVTSIGEYAFNDCTSLTEILVVPSNPDFTNVDGVLFNENQTTLVEYPGGLAGAYTIPSSVTSIGAGAFWFCPRLTSVTFPGSVTSIGDDAFTYCGGLTSVTIGANITSIGEGAFADCSGLTGVTIPSSVTGIGEGAFYGCPSLTSIAVNASNPDFSSVDGVLFNQNQTMLAAYPGGLTGAYTITNSVTSIEAEAFGGCPGLTDVYIPSSVTSLGDFAFESCNSLTGAYFQGNAPTPGVEVFDDVNAAAKVYYFAGTTGWSTTYGGLPTVMLNPPAITGIGVQSNEFGFTIIGTNTQVVVVEACTNLANANWQPIQTNTLTAASFNFADLEWTNFPIRFYRIGSIP
jgi:hypothetical protein